MVIYGPGNPGLCHQTDECIETADLQASTELFKNVICKFLS
jgi:acetylornithine deacetylase/succinyl-diaminopimelate desuccinylase-like protein